MRALIGRGILVVRPTLLDWGLLLEGGGFAALALVDLLLWRNLLLQLTLEALSRLERGTRQRILVNNLLERTLFKGSEGLLLFGLLRVLLVENGGIRLEQIFVGEMLTPLSYLS